MSILPITQVDYEVLLIDDGSVGDVGVYCKGFADDHPSFQYHYKENGGVSSARNLGLSLAKGRYVTFVDADDAIYVDVLEKYTPLDDTQDLVLFDILLTQGGIDSIWYAFDLPEGSLTREQVLYQLLTASSISGPVAKLYKAELLKKAKLLFDTSFVSGEDWMFVTAYVLQAERFSYCKETSYRYFRDESTGQERTARFPDQMVDNQLSRYVKKQDILKTQVWKEFSIAKIQHLASVELTENLFNSAADLLLAGLYTKERKQKIYQAIKQAGTFLTEEVPKKTKLKKWIITQFPPALGLLAVLRKIYLKRKR